MAKWELISVQVMNQFEDEVVWQVNYKRPIRNHYRFKTGLTMMDDYRDRKIGESRALDGGKWVEGTMKSKGRKPTKKTPPTPYQLYVKKMKSPKYSGRILSLEGFLKAEEWKRWVSPTLNIREHRKENPNCELVGCCNAWPEDWY